MSDTNENAQVAESEEASVDRMVSGIECGSTVMLRADDPYCVAELVCGLARGHIGRCESDTCDISGCDVLVSWNDSNEYKPWLEFGESEIQYFHRKFLEVSRALDVSEKEIHRLKAMLHIAQHRDRFQEREQ